MDTAYWERDEDDDDDDGATSVSTENDSFERRAALDELMIRVRSRSFQRGRVMAVLSKVTVDLRDARLSLEGATLDVQSALSGIEILVPSHWDVLCDVDTVYGGVDRGGAAMASDRPVPRLRVTGTVVAGGLCVR